MCLAAKAGGGRSIHVAMRCAAVRVCSLSAPTPRRRCLAGKHRVGWPQGAWDVGALLPCQGRSRASGGWVSGQSLQGPLKRSTKGFGSEGPKSERGGRAKNCRPDGARAWTTRPTRSAPRQTKCTPDRAKHRPNSTPSRPQIDPGRPCLYKCRYEVWVLVLVTVLILYYMGTGTVLTLCRACAGT